ncbi:hypothetical protein C8R47DRAFT_1283733 [Mycena vitilis]|nr:hypothetical protein C8R47DRAFT_1283733 [Mycena vitilis]
MAVVPMRMAVVVAQHDDDACDKSLITLDVGVLHVVWSPFVRSTIEDLGCIMASGALSTDDISLPQTVVHHVALPSSSEFLSFLAPALNRLLGLQTIVFLDGPDQHSWECVVFANTPRLRTLGLRQEAHPANLPPLPWTQLTHASIHPGSYTPLSIFTVASELQEIILRTGGSPDRWSSSSVRLTLGVQKVVLAGHAAQGFLAKILGDTDTPRLKELFLVKCGAWDLPDISPLIQSSGCRLEALVLQDTRIRARDLLTLLSAIPTLETLVLTDNIPNTATNTLLQALTPAPGEPVLLPQLCTFVLTGSYLFSTDALLVMLERRTGAQNEFSSLTTLDITLSDRAFSPAELERFAALRGVKSSCLGFELGETAGRFTSGYIYDRDWEYDEGSLVSKVSISSQDEYCISFVIMLLLELLTRSSIRSLPSLASWGRALKRGA